MKLFKKIKVSARDEFLKLVPANARRILDVGCGEGKLTSGLKDAGAEVIGVESCEDLCQAAAKKLTKIHPADVEKFELPYPSKYFDCILYADVVEHLIDPLVLLKKHMKFLRDNGCVIASIPNVRYYKLLIRLVFAGVWDYMPCGILDRTHLRFFTLTNIKELFAEAGYEIVEIKRNCVASKVFRLLNFILCDSLRELLVYQYYIKTKKSDTPPDISKRIRCQF